MLELVIPIYKPTLSAREAFALDHSLAIMAAYRQTFIAPLGLDVAYYAQRYHGRFQFFPQEYFASVHGYSRLLISTGFYESFPDCDYLLIVQPDVYIFHDDLPFWLSRGVDYVGAPWPDGLELSIQFGKFAAIGGKPLKVYVGNGGFSLRRRQACLNLIREHEQIAEWFVQTGSNEDLFFAFMGSLSENFLIPNQIMASRFSLELRPEEYMTLNGGKLPMGVHAFEKHTPDFWRNHMPAWPD